MEIATTRERADEKRWIAFAPELRATAQGTSGSATSRARPLDPGAAGTVRMFILALMFVAALTLLAASAVHASLLGPIDPFPGAAPPEALLGAVLAIAAVAAFLSWARAWPFAVAATLLALLGTVYGLTVTVPRGDPGDVVYHVILLAGLIVAAGLLIRRRGLVD